MNFDQLAAGLVVTNARGTIAAPPPAPAVLPVRYAPMYRDRIPSPAPQPPPQQPRPPAEARVNLRELTGRAITDLGMDNEQILLIVQKAKDFHDGKAYKKEFITALGNIVGNSTLRALMKRIIKEKTTAASTRKWSFLPNKAPDEKTPSECKVCLSQPSEVVFTGCGHVCICLDCTDQLPSMKPNAHAKCVLCNQESKVQTCYFTK